MINLLQVFDKLLLRVHNLMHFESHNLKGPYSKIACTKEFWTKAVKVYTRDPAANLAWIADGPNGINDEVCSESILVDWLTTEDNYTQIAGNSDGDTKVAVAKKIIKLFEEARIVKERKPVDILQKVTSFRSTYNIAYEWTQNTGAGIDKDSISFSEMCIKKIQVLE